MVHMILCATFGFCSKITDWLTSEGHIYTSIDSEHFLTTDG